MAAHPGGVAIELLAGIPSIIYGMWGLFVFAPIFSAHIKPWLTSNLGNKPDDGKLSWVAQHVPFVGKLFASDTFGAALVAGMMLAIMIIPFIASVMREVFQMVPTLLKESAYALGSTHMGMSWLHGAALHQIGVIGGIMLGLGRALGETMAVAFVIGNSMSFSAGPVPPG